VEYTTINYDEIIGVYNRTQLNLLGISKVSKYFKYGSAFL